MKSSKTLKDLVQGQKYAFTHSEGGVEIVFIELGANDAKIHCKLLDFRFKERKPRVNVEYSETDFLSNLNSGTFLSTNKTVLSC
jgi:hypothetical protein